MRIVITRETIADGAIVAAGGIVDADIRTAELLVAIGKARVVTEPEVTEEEKAQLIANPSAVTETAIKSAPEKRKKVTRGGSGVVHAGAS